MNTIHFLGAAGMVTGSCFEVSSSDGGKLVVDVGMFQGGKELTSYNHQPLLLQGSSIEAVVVTHAHLDHCGRLPLLLKTGFSGPIYMTEATRALVELTLLDAAKIAQEQTDRTPLFTEEDVLKILEYVEIVPYNSPFETKSFILVMRDAGHILGSSCVEIHDKKSQKHIVFSGDLGNSPEALVQPTYKISKADVVVMEATYGDRVHASENPLEILQKEINVIEKTKGTLLIPAFSVERSQELLHAIDHLKKDGKINHETGVFLDSPMAIKATHIYKQFKNLYSAELENHANKDDPFDFPGLVLCDTVAKSKHIRTVPNPKIILAGSGMLTGGRILYHLVDYLGISSTRMVIVGYQAEHTLGRTLLEGSTHVSVHSQKIEVRAIITKMSGFSAHADQPKLISWLGSIKGVNRVFLVHGESAQRNILAEKIKTDLHIKDIELPFLHETKKA